MPGGAVEGASRHDLPRPAPEASCLLVQRPEGDGEEEGGEEEKEDEADGLVPLLTSSLLPVWRTTGILTLFVSIHVVTVVVFHGSSWVP